jgi:hypothetical protein
MPFGSVTLVPGVNVERTPTLLRAGVSQSSLIRYRDSLVQKLGGWSRFYPFQLTGTVRDLHAWQDLSLNSHLAIGATNQLSIITNGTLQNVTPQQFVSDLVPNISTTNGSPVVGITDPNITDVTTYDAVFFNVPVSQGGLILDGLYQIASVTGTHSYTIIASQNATATTTNPVTTNATTASGNPTLHFASTPAWVVQDLSIWDITTPSAIPTGTQVSATGATTVTMNQNAAGAGVGAADNIVFASIPVFITAAGSSLITVNFVAHGITQAGGSIFLAVSTTGNGVTIGGHYVVISVTDANNFTIQANAAASATGRFPMNNGNAEIVYNIALGPASPGVGYGLGLYGAGAYGFGTGSTSPQTGTPITATDWTLDNWGELLMACPEDGGIYVFDPTGGFLNAAIISEAPPKNTGMFVSTTAQILIAFGSSLRDANGLGYTQEPLLVQWSDQSDYTNWTPTPTTQAGNYVIPLGSKIVAGMAVSTQNLLWTDLDVWAMNYQGQPFIYGFTKIGAGAGAVSSHSVQQLRGAVYWMGPSNFFIYNGSGVSVIPCPVWDAVFQNLNTAFLSNIRAMPNTPYNEVGWFYPSSASTSGECDSYVKVNISEPGAPWDYGPMSRTAWIDQTVLGPPIAASASGLIYQHETSPNADGGPLTSSFTTGFFYLAEGEEFAYVDQILPDFKWGTFAGTPSATIQLTFNITNYPGETPVSYGPYSVTQATQYLAVRFRGRLMSITVASSDLDSFWRIGSIKYRFAPAGRR